MEDTIGSKFDRNTGQIFRITFKNRELEVILLKKSLTKNESEIEILLDGVIQRLVKINNEWHFEGVQADKELAKDIWGAISLRYRLW